MKEKKDKKRLTKNKLADMLQSLFMRNPGKQFSFKQIFKELRLNTHPAKMQAVEMTEDMAWDDILVKTGENSYKLNLKGQVQEGRFIRKPNGKNSFVPDDGTQPVFVAERNSLSALTGDRVRVTFMARRQKHIKEAMVTEILERARDQFVGRLKVERDFAYLVPDGNVFANNIILPKNKLKGGKTGEKAVVKVTRWPEGDNKNIIGEVVDVLGEQGDNDVEMHSILAQYGLPYKYPKRVEEAAEKISAEITEQDYKEREDFRNVTTFTIDPHDAKDFDDALSIRRLADNLWEVGVHIADVSHYVTEGSIIDKEAQKRATSVYLVDRTIPMLPERLCNFICSLRPDEEKLTYSAVFNIDGDGEVKSWRLVHAVIKSNRRFAYEEVQQILEDNGVKEGTGEPAPPAGPGGYRGEYADELITLDRIAKKLRAARFKNGSVKFDREEMRFDVDEKGKPIRCYFKKSKDANKLIEEFMLLANRYVAESVGKVKKGQKAKTLPYRIHDQPDPTKLETLRRREQNLIEMVALRAMMKAKYSVHNIGHYGLAFDYYTHFTSPIRRYPDTMVHRLLTRYQNGGRSANKEYYEELCEHASDMEQVAAEFMADKIGNEYDAHISGITSYGIYCEIDENHCEGMVPLHDLDDDYYEFDERNYCLIGRRHHHRYQLGDPVRIVVAKANVEKKQLDFSLSETPKK